jgi:predicted nucleotidyltransferase
VLKEHPEESDDLTVYLNVRAKYVKLAMIENRLNKSFERRIDSMYTWFEEQIVK